MELVNGGNLYDKVKHRSRLTVKLAREYFLQILDALDYMHEQNIAHCDVKAKNLLVGENGKLKLCDFGLSRRTKDCCGKHVRYRVG